MLAEDKWNMESLVEGDSSDYQLRLRNSCGNEKAEAACDVNYNALYLFAVSYEERGGT